MRKIDESVARGNIELIDRVFSSPLPLPPLSQRAADLKMSLANVEKEKGVSGFTDTQEELERVSALKGDLDIKKAASLEEMSKMVTKLKDRFDGACCA